MLLLGEGDQAQQLFYLERGLRDASGCVSGLTASKQRQCEVLVRDLPMELAAAQEELQLVSEEPNSNLPD